MGFNHAATEHPPEENVFSLVQFLERDGRQHKKCCKWRFVFCVPQVTSATAKTRTAYFENLETFSLGSFAFPELLTVRLFWRGQLLRRARIEIFFFPERVLWATPELNMVKFTMLCRFDFSGVENNIQHST